MGQTNIHLHWLHGPAYSKTPISAYTAAEVL